MSRECRRVPPDWEHPKDENGKHIPLKNGAKFEHAHAQWQEEKARWDQGEVVSFDGYGDRFWIPKPVELAGAPFPEPDGPEPDPRDYMPVWPASQATHYQMYETTTEGTPISPVMTGKEELARWLTDSGANAYARQTASYEAWLEVCEGRETVSGVIDNGRIISGVEFAVRPDQRGRSI